MNYPRVNLLKKSEQRYQGAVSRRFIMISVVVTPILLTALLSGVKLIQYTGIQSDLKANREIWETLEPKLELYKEESRGLAVNRQVLDLFKGWEDSQLPVVDLMDGIQGIVPLNVQFSRLSLRGEVAPVAYVAPEEMQMSYRMQIDGIAQGDRAEDDIWKFHRDLLGTADVDAAFENVELTDMRKRKADAGTSMREFKILASNKTEVEP